MPVGKDGRFTAPVADYEGMQVFDANPLVIDHLKAATRGEGPTGSVTPGTVLLRRESYDHSYPHCWRCREPLIYKGVSVVVRRGHRDQGADARAQRADHLGARARQARPVRQVARERPRLVDHPQPVLGQPGPGLEVRRPRLPPRRRLRLVRARSSATSATCRATGPATPTCTGPFVDELTRPNPDDPTGPLDDAPRRRTSSTCGSTPGSMSFAQVHYPFENAEWFEHHFPARLHRRVHRADPRLVLHAARPRHGALRPAGVRELHEPRHRPRQRRPEDEQVAAQLPRRQRGLRPRRRRRDALVPHGLARSCAAATSSSPRRASARRAPGAAPAVDVLVLLLAVRQRVHGRHRLRGPLVDGVPGPAGPLPPGQAARPRRGDHQPDGRLRRARRLRVGAWLRRRAHQLVHPALTRAVLGHRLRRLVCSGGGLRHAVHDARGADPRRGAAAAARHRGGLARAHRRALGAPDRLAGRPRTCPATRRSSRRWTRCAPSAPPGPRCARPRGSGSGCRCGS